jgi:hypothetical protein
MMEGQSMFLGDFGGFFLGLLFFLDNGVGKVGSVDMDVFDAVSFAASQQV